jgi:hypothetical protein
VARKGDRPVSVHEVRLLHGRPTRAALERVFAAELCWRRRAFYAMSRDLDGELPEVRFNYSDPDSPQRDLNSRIESHRTASRSPFLALTSGSGILSRPGFAAMAAEVLTGVDRSLRPAVDPGGGLTVEAGGRTAMLDLRSAYRRYLREPPALEAAVVDALQALRARQALVGELGPRDRERLLPVLRPDEGLPPDAVWFQLVTGIRAVLAVERGAEISEVPRAALAAMELAEEEALAAARRRVSSLAAEARAVPLAGPVGRVELAPPLPAGSLLLWPGLAGLLCDASGEGAAVATPSADLLLYAPLSAAGGAEFRSAVERRFDSTLEPVSEAALRLGPEGPTAI